MAVINKSWGERISELLAAHNLSLRAAFIKAGGKPSHTTIKDWCDGIVPHDRSMAVHFLSHFPREQAIQCLESAGIPIPPEWGKDADRVTVQHMRKAAAEILEREIPNLPLARREQIADSIVERAQQMIGEL